MTHIIASGSSATVTVSQALVPAGQEPFAIVAAITVTLLAIGTFALTAADRRSESRNDK